MKCEVWLYQSEFDISRIVNSVISREGNKSGYWKILETVVFRDFMLQWLSKIGYKQMNFKDHDIINLQCDIKFNIDNFNSFFKSLFLKLIYTFVFFCCRNEAKMQQVDTISQNNSVSYRLILWDINLKCSLLINLLMLYIKLSLIIYISFVWR